MNETQHILSRFDEALNKLRHDLSRMSALAEQNLALSMRGLLERDMDLCNQVIAEDETVDVLEKAIDADGILALTRFTPVAQDLRQIISTMKVSSNLERVSDQAVNIARRAKRLLQGAVIPETQRLEPMFTQAISLLRDAVKAFKDEDIPLAISLKSRDKILDVDHKDYISDLTQKMEQDTTLLKDYIDLIFIARFIERAGDHSVNIGEDAVYAGAAQDIRHIHPANTI